MKIFSSVIALVVSTLLAGTTLAAPVKFDFDKAHSTIHANWNHRGYSTSWAEFTDWDGSFSFDADNWSNSSVEIVIKAHSIETGDGKWDAHMMTADFFDAYENTDITFKSTKVEKTGDNAGKLHGDLTVKGVTQPVVLDLRLNKIDDAGTENRKVGFHAEGNVKRSEFGLAKYIDFGVGDEVNIIIDIEAVSESAE